MVQGVFIPLEPCCIQIREWLKNPLFLATLMENKYLLHIINEIVSIVGPLRDLVYT
jgi:hypothetical protein